MRMYMMFSSVQEGCGHGDGALSGAAGHRMDAPTLSERDEAAAPSPGRHGPLVPSPRGAAVVVGRAPGSGTGYATPSPMAWSAAPRERATSSARAALPRRRTRSRLRLGPGIEVDDGCRVTAALEHRVLTLDGRTVEPAPSGFLAALARELGREGVTTVASRGAALAGRTSARSLVDALNA